MPSRGRPRADQPREHVVTIRLTREEKTGLMQRAGKLGISISDYVRRIIRSSFGNGNGHRNGDGNGNGNGNGHAGLNGRGKRS